MTGLLTRWTRRAQAPPVAVTVYTRRECCCCHTALTLLQQYRRKYHLDITETDVDDDPALVEAHGPHIPVVMIDGKIRFRGVVNPVLLERLLNARET